MKAFIFTGGEVHADSLARLGIHDLDKARAKGAVVIAADSGYTTAMRLGVHPDLLLGDFDSLDKRTLKPGELEQINKIIVPAIKDDTDTQLAVDTAIEQYHATDITLIGGLGGRLDHTLSSVFLLEYAADKGVSASLCDGNNRVHLLCAAGTERMETIQRFYKYLSLIALSDSCEGVSISGVFYPLDGATLTRGYSYAVSNEITAPHAQISLLKGKLLIIESSD